jgi:hypothetical protein
MKKKIFYMITGTAIALVAVWNVSQNRNKKALTDIALVNVEALADNETPTYDCPGGSVECVRVTSGTTVHIFHKQNSGS